MVGWLFVVFSIFCIGEFFKFCLEYRGRYKESDVGSDVVNKSLVFEGEIVLGIWMIFVECIR